MTDYSDGYHGDHAVLADLAQRAELAENSVDSFEITQPTGSPSREIVRLLRREGSEVTETLLDADEFAPVPRHKTGLVTMATVPSLIQYVDKHREPGTEVWVDRDKAKFVAVLDDHQAGDDMEAFTQAGWGDHRAVCDLKPTKDFLLWTKLDGRLVAQYDFAEHIEQGLHCIVSPPAADLLEVAQTLMGSRNAVFRSGQRLSNGEVQFRYEEDVQGRAGAGGNIEIPQTFQLRLPVFEGTEPVDLVASFRWRLNDGHVLLGYRLQRVEDLVRMVIDDLIEKVETDLGIRTFLGVPRPSRLEYGGPVSLTVNVGQSRTALR